VLYAAGIAGDRASFGFLIIVFVLFVAKYSYGSILAVSND
jgi:hypothetical protein